MNKQTNPLFSVVIPLYNKRSHILRTIESVLSQSFADFEIVIIDDGSTDGGPNRVQFHYGKEIAEQKLRLIRQVNGGVSVARNKGVSEARGEIVAFLDADDTWEPHFLEEVAELNFAFPDAGAFATGYQFVVDKETYIDPKIRFKRQIDKPRILDDYFEVGARGALPFTMSSFCIKKALFTDLGRFPVGEAMGEDQDLFCRTAIHSQIAYSPSVLSFYHQDAENRACEENVPSSECGFSERLREHANSESSVSKKRELMQYVAAHVLHLASLNVRAGRFEVASRLLNDTCCKLHYMRYLSWKFRSMIAKLTFA